MKIRLDIPLFTNEVVSALGTNVHLINKKIEYVTTDSRECDDGSLFFALGDGEKYIAEARSKNAVCIGQSECADVQVSDTKAAMLILASYYKLRLKSLKHTVAITGSVGKSCVKDYTAALLKSKFKTHKTLGNFNNNIGLPLSVFASPKDTEVLVLEMGMNHTGEIKELSLAIKPTLSVITSIGSAHIGNLGSRENIAKAKREICFGLPLDGTSIVPSGEPLLDDLKNKITVGCGGDFSIQIARSEKDCLVFDISSKDYGVLSDVSFPFGGEHFATNLAFAVAVSLRLGLSLSEIKESLLNISDFIPRQKYVKIGKRTFYCDTYNASPESFFAAFKTVSLTKGRKYALIGDVLELGESSEFFHEQIGKAAVKYGFKRIYAFGKYSKSVCTGAITSGLDERFILVNTDINSPEITAKQILDTSCGDETILIKGSHAVGVERILEYIKEFEGESNV